MDTWDWKVTGINHLVLHVVDLTRSVKFYTEVLGLDNDLSRGTQNAAFLRCGTFGLGLLEVAGDVDRGKEMNHMALNVAADVVTEVVGKLERAGVHIDKQRPGNSVFIHDPDGYKIEILPRCAHQRAGEREADKAAI